MKDFESIIRGLNVKRILDIATGSGDCLNWLMEMIDDFELMVGIDVSEDALKKARETIKHERIIFKPMDTANLEFDDESFDLVTVCYSLHHFANLEKSLEEIIRVIKPGGWALVIEMYRDSPRETQQTHVQLHDWWAEIDEASGISHNKTFTRQQILDLLDDLELIEGELFDNHGDDEHAHNEELIQKLTERCTAYPDKIRDQKSYEALRQRGLEMLERLKTVGYAPASQLVVLMQKP